MSGSVEPTPHVGGERGGGRVYRILVVCTGNICRSPFAERLLRARLAAALGPDAERVEVTSAGTHGLVGEPMMAESAETLLRYGGSPDGFVACALEPGLIEQADLVLALTREHRGAVVTMVPRALSRTLTLREYARLLEGVTKDDLAVAGSDPVERLQAITGAAFRRRGYAPAEDPLDDDVPDPFGKALSAYEGAAALIDEALSVPLSLLSA
jgi:protein-tyrosine phosphatase